MKCSQPLCVNVHINTVIPQNRKVHNDDETICHRLIISVIFYPTDWIVTLLHVSAICLYHPSPHFTPVCNPPLLQTANGVSGVLSISCLNIRYHQHLCQEQTVTLVFLLWYFGYINVSAIVCVKGARVKVRCRISFLRTLGINTSRTARTVVC